MSKRITQKRQFNFIFCLVTFVSILSPSTEAKANFKNWIQKRDFRAPLAAAVAEASSSFQYNDSSQEVTLAIEYGSNTSDFRAHQGSGDQIKILLAPQTQFEIRSIESTAVGPVANLLVSLPKSVEPNHFEIRLLSMNTKISAEDLDPSGPQLDTQTLLRLRLEIIRLTKTFEGESKKKQPSALGSTKLPSPIKLLEWIKQGIVPTAYNTLPAVVFLQLLQETRAITPSSKFRPESLPTASAPTPDTQSEEYQNCISLGGVMNSYFIGESEALLCRFGEAGVGASSLLNYRKGKGAKSIEALLNFIKPNDSEQNDLAIIPQGNTESGAVGNFVAKPNPHPESMQPGIRMILPPKVQISAYCRQRSGKPTQLRHPIDGTPLKACIFDDFSGIDATTLFKGPTDPSNQKLVNVLKSLK